MANYGWTLENATWDNTTKYCNQSSTVLAQKQTYSDHWNRTRSPETYSQSTMKETRIYNGEKTVFSKRCWKSWTVQSVQFSCSFVSDSLRPHESQLARLPCPSPTPGVHPNSCPSSQWCHPAISFSVVPFSSCPQSLPASETFPMSQLFAWGSQSIGVSALASVLPVNIQHWFPLEWTGWIPLQFKGLSRVFSNTTVQKHQFFRPQLSSRSNSRIHTWGLQFCSREVSCLQPNNGLVLKTVTN